MTKRAISNLYTLCIGVSALALGLLSAFWWPLILDTSTLWLLLIFTFLVALAGRFPFKVSPQGDATLLTVPLFTAILLMHPAIAGIAGLVGTLVSEYLLKARRDVLVFNTSVSGLVGVLSGIAYWLLKPDTASLIFTPFGLLAIVVSGLVLHAADLSLLFGMITLVKGKGFWERWKDTWQFESILDGSLLVLGAIGAQLATLSWWWIIILTIPFAVIYYGFRKSVEEVVQKTKLAQELDETLAELKKTQAQLVQSAKLAGIGTLVAGLAHEINNPLAIINGKCEVLLAKYRLSKGMLSSDRVIRDIQSINDMGNRISTILGQLLNYSRSSEDMTDSRLDAVINTAVEIMEGKTEKKSIKLVRAYDQKPVIAAVSTQLQQVFVNLLSNAIDAVPEWGTITVGCRIESETAVAFVKDTGVGIPEDIRDRIFEPFFTSKEIGKGTGLGLYVCHNIVSDHGGQIVVESEEGVGTTFYVKLPLIRDAEQAVSSSAASAS